MKTIFGIITAALLGLNAFAQIPGAGTQGNFDAQLTKLFGNNQAFSAKSDIRIFDKDKKETTALTMDFAMLDGNVRNDLDMATMKTKEISPDAAAQMKIMGMDKIITITRKDTKAVYLIYPNMKASTKMPLPKEQADALGKDPKMEKIAMGKETIDGHPCEKSKVIFTDDKGQKREVFVWSAADLKDFPVRIETTDQDTTVQMSFRQVQLAKPDAKLFELPKGFTEYDGVQALMAAVMQKMLAKPQ